MRGLKWTLTLEQAHLACTSHPLRMRGLKYESNRDTVKIITSHPLRMRGLKFVMYDIYFHPLVVASFTDAWIEIDIVI